MIQARTVYGMIHIELWGVTGWNIFGSLISLFPTLFPGRYSIIPYRTWRRGYTQMELYVGYKGQYDQTWTCFDIVLNLRHKEMVNVPLSSSTRIEIKFSHETIRGMFEMNCLFLSGDFKFQASPKYSFHALEVLPVARNAKFQPMYPILEGVTVRWFGHSNKVLMNGRSKCLSGLVFLPSKECFQFRKQKEITWGKVWGIRGVRQNSYFFFLQKRRNYCGGMSWGIVM